MKTLSSASECTILEGEKLTALLYIFFFKPIEKFFEVWSQEFVKLCVTNLHHVVNQVNLGDDCLPLCFFHEVFNVSHSKANQKVHDYNGKESDVGSKEEVGGS